MPRQIDMKKIFEILGSRYLLRLPNFKKNLISQPKHNEPRHEISNNVVCAISKGSDQSAHMRSVIRAFASPLNIL